MSEFKKLGIFPFNFEIIPRENFSKDVLERWEKHLSGSLREKIGKKEGKVKKKAEDSESYTTDVDSDNEVHYANSDESKCVEEEAEVLSASDNEDEMNKENKAEEETGPDINKWVIVKYILVKGHKYYVGFVQKQIDSRWEIKFVRRKGATFAWPIIGLYRRC
ncbi:unnamed protein product [Parnassius apollo]|uniref:(apollo) hypothetical protein n=1 Tax=Parnassius apollo TaxID=110799 RepID=A0A8S3Y2G6_PARAO|nr:unnamed protein product [Parnassius apollo]